VASSWFFILQGLERLQCSCSLMNASSSVVRDKDPCPVPIQHWFWNRESSRHSIVDPWRTIGTVQGWY